MFTIIYWLKVPKPKNIKQWLQTLLHRNVIICQKIMSKILIWYDYLLVTPENMLWPMTMRVKFFSPTDFTQPACLAAGKQYTTQRKDFDDQHINLSARLAVCWAAIYCTFWTFALHHHQKPRFWFEKKFMRWYLIFYSIQQTYIRWSSLF